MIRLGALGDVVRTLPAGSSLRAAYPGAHLAWLVEPSAATALEEQPWIDEVLVFPRPKLSAALRQRQLEPLLALLGGFVSTLRARRFDLVVDFHSLLRSALLSWVSGARRRVGLASPFGTEGSWWLAGETAELEPAKLSRFDRNSGLVEYLGVEAKLAAQPFAVSPADRARAEASLAPGRVPVALHPGTSEGTPYKRWRVDGYSELARRLRDEDGLPSVVTYGPAREDRALAEAVVEGADGAARLAPQTLTLRELAALMASVRICVGADTGPLHVASLVGTPVVQLLGPTDPVENAPFSSTPSRSLRTGIECSPCRNGCAAATCMREIDPESVLCAVRDLLGGSALPEWTTAVIRGAA